MWFAILLLLSSITLMICVTRRRKFVALVDLVPGPKGWPLLGNMAHIGVFTKDTPEIPRQAILLERMKALNELYGKDGIYRLWLGFRQYFIITNYKTFEALFSSTTNISKSVDYRLVHSWLGTGLLTSTGVKWKTRRKLLTPTFHFRILEDFLSVINEQSMILTDIMKNISSQDETDIVPLISRYTLDIICETAMGISINAMQNLESVYISNLNRVTKMVVDRVPKVWMWSDFVYNLTQEGKEYNKSVQYVHDFALKIIRDRKVSFEKVDLPRDSPEDTNLNIKNQKRRLAFLDILLNEHMNNPDFLEEHIREEVDTFMFEGHDTTAMGLSWSLYLIGLYPDIQKKICEELESIFGRDDEERLVTFEDLKEMKYLECVVKEVHRLYPPVPFIGRCLSEDTKLNGYMIPKGSQVFINISIGHRDPKVFPQPEVFNPDNFLPENSANRNAFVHVPFSAGPRNCIGQKFALMEEKVTLVNILRNFTIESLDSRDKVVMSGEAVLRPVGGLRMRIRAKNNRLL